MNEQLHFNEGLYLEPHHLQAMQRGIYARMADERRLSFGYPYGLIEAKLSSDALENHLVQFATLRVVMPSGLLVEVPDNADLPPLNIRHAFDSGTEPFTVSLGVPLWSPDRSNAFEPGGNDDWRSKQMFRVATRSLADENTGENPQPVLIRRINARLLLEDDDRTDLEVVPLLRIAHAVGQDVGLPQQDASFIPPCLLLSGSVVLRDMVRDLANQVEATRKELVAQMSRGFNVETMRGPQFEQMLRLLTLNRYSVRLQFIAEMQAVTTAQAYLELRGLLAELAALQPGNDVYDVAGYDHDNPAISFMDLNQQIRPHLRSKVRGRYSKVDFTPADGGMFAQLSEEHLAQANEYFIAVRSKQDPRGVAALVQDEDRFKLMARSMIRQAVRGVKLQEERQPPLQLPTQTGVIYFRLLRTESARMWEMIQREKIIGARWVQMESSDFQLALYMTLPEDAPVAAAPRPRT